MGGRDVLLRVAQWVLRVVAGLFLVGAAANVLGSSGTQSLYDRHVPTGVAAFVQRLWPHSGESPSSPVLIRPNHWADSYESFNQMPKEGGIVPPGFAEFNGGRLEVVGRVGEVTFRDPGLAARATWVAAAALMPVGSAWLWWMLSSMAASARRADPFDRRNARRLGVAGALVLLGPPLVMSVQQLALRWMLAGSTAAGKADIWFRVEQVPIWPVAAGLALVVLAAVWRRGVAMREDLEGLV